MKRSYMSSQIISHEQRQLWANSHAVSISTLLETPTLREIEQRLFRVRYWNGGEYTVASIVQNMHPAENGVKLHIFCVRAYTAAALNLAGLYSPDEVVAFLGLDTVDPDALHWADETKYSGLVVVSDIIKKTLH